MKKMTKNNLKNIIVTLDATDISVREDFDDISDNFFDNLINKYPNKTLDIYGTQLEEGSEELVLFDSTYFRLDNEIKYLKWRELSKSRRLRSGSDEMF